MEERPLNTDKMLEWVGLVVQMLTQLALRGLRVELQKCTKTLKTTMKKILEECMVNQNLLQDKH